MSIKTIAKSKTIGYSYKELANVQFEPLAVSNSSESWEVLFIAKVTTKCHFTACEAG